MRQMWNSMIIAALLLISSALFGQSLTVHNGHEKHTLTQAQLKAIKPTKLTTITPWTNTADTFEGIYLSDLLTHFDIDATQLNARALNDYEVKIDIQAATAAGAFIASHQNGQTMTIRNKGPFWVIFPWSNDPGLHSRSVQTWSIWQMIELTAE